MQDFLVLASAFLIFTRKYSSSLLQSARIARSRESVQDSCRPVKPCKASHRLENGVTIFADSKQRLRPLPFLSRTGNVLHFPIYEAFVFYLKENRNGSRSEVCLSDRLRLCGLCALAHPSCFSLYLRMRSSGAHPTVSPSESRKSMAMSLNTS